MATAAGVKDKHQVPLLCHVVREVAGQCPDVKQLPKQLRPVASAAEVQVCSPSKLAYSIVGACPHSGSHIRARRLLCCAVLCCAVLCCAVLCCAVACAIIYMLYILTLELGWHGVPGIKLQVAT